MSYITLGRSRSDDFPLEMFIISKELNSKEEAMSLLSALTPSFYDLKIAEIVDSFDNAAAVVIARQSKGSANSQIDNGDYMAAFKEVGRMLDLDSDMSDTQRLENIRTAVQRLNTETDRFCE